MTKYYFLGTLLPTLSLETEPEIGFEEFKQLCRANLTSDDLELLKGAYLWVDLNNLNALWSHRTTTYWGNYTSEELLDLPGRTPVPPFLETFLKKYLLEEDRIAHFDELMLGYFSHAYEQAWGFFKEWLQYEQVLKVALATKRATKVKKSFQSEINLFDPFDPWQGELKDIADEKNDVLGLKEAVQEALDLFDSDFKNPLDLFKQLLLLRFEKVNQLKSPYSPFSVDNVLAYAIQLELAGEWQKVSHTKNQVKVTAMLKDIP